MCVVVRSGGLHLTATDFSLRHSQAQPHCACCPTMMRKRTRAQAFAESIAQEQPPVPADSEGPAEETEEEKEARREKQLEIWEAFKEENYEGESCSTFSQP
jgi:hypothetical protein